MSDPKRDPRDDYGPPLEDQKLQKAVTSKQVLLQGSSSQSSLQNLYTPLSPYQIITPRPRAPLALPASSSTSNLVQLAKTPLHSIQVANTSLHSQQLQETYTPLQIERPKFTPPSKDKEKLPFYTPPANTPPCPFIPKSYKLPLFTL